MCKCKINIDNILLGFTLPVKPRSFGSQISMVATTTKFDLARYWVIFFCKYILVFAINWIQLSKWKVEISCLSYCSYLEEKRLLVEDALEKSLESTHPNTETIIKSMKYSLMAGGKRVRPILCLAAAEMFGGSEAVAMPSGNCRILTISDNVLANDFTQPSCGYGDDPHNELNSRRFASDGQRRLTKRKTNKSCSIWRRYRYIGWRCSFVNIVRACS